jgi:hypothetical protein
LIEHWDGTSWAIITSPDTSALQSYSFLYSVTCGSASNCWAVGYYYNGSNDHALIEHWDGTSWTIVSSPNITGNNYLFGITCVSGSNCWAAGRYAGSSANQTLIEHWDGTSWAVVSSPSTSTTQDNILESVTCTSASDCWAAGYYYSGSVYRTLVEHWNESGWTIVTSPNITTPTQDNLLHDVACTSASACWAVGVSGSINQTLIERWDGTSWSIVSSPNTSATQNNLLDGVTCASASACWAAGYYFGNTGVQTLIEQWDGTSWSIVTSPNTSSTQNNALFGVTCAPLSDCWAVGYYFNGQTLVLKYTSSPPPTPVSVASRKTHGTAGDFDIDLPLCGNAGIESRIGGANDSYQIVITFPNAVTFKSAVLTSGTGTVSTTSGSDTPVLTVNLTGVSNAQIITLTLFGLNDGTNTGDVSIPMGILVGDVNGSGRVDAADVSSVRQQTLQPITSSNFRNDINASGRIDAADVSIARQQTLTSLP